jgi:hypothetical protein
MKIFNSVKYYHLQINLRHLQINLRRLQINLRRFKRFKFVNDRLVTKDIFIHLRGWKVPLRGKA